VGLAADKEGPMIRAGSLATLTALLLLTSTVLAQNTPARFRWQPGQVLNYKVEQLTTVSDAAEGTKADSSTKLSEIKRWQVLAVDAAGVATVQLSLPSLRLETTTPGGDVLLFDSANPDKSNAQLREQLSKYVNAPLAILRIDSLGKVVEVKECKHGSASKFEAELPFIVALPAEGIRMGQSWERPYQVTLDPPQGTGEKYPAVQKFTCKAIQGTVASLALTTTLKSLPEAVADQVPLLQMQPEGEIVFDLQTGCVRKVQMQIDKELKGHQGEGSSYRFKSSYTQEWMANN